MARKKNGKCGTKQHKTHKPAQNSTNWTNFCAGTNFGGDAFLPPFLQVCLHDGKIGVDYAIRMKLYNPLFRMVARFFSYIIVHVADFYCIFETISMFFSYIYLRIPSYLGLRGEPFIFSDSFFTFFRCSFQRFYTNSYKSLILFYGSFLKLLTL